MGKTKRLLYGTKLTPDSPKRTEGLLLSQNNYFPFLLSFFSLQSTKNKKTLANSRENTLSETCKGLFGFAQDGATSLFPILYSIRTLQPTLFAPQLRGDIGLEYDYGFLPGKTT